VRPFFRIFDGRHASAVEYEMPLFDKRRLLSLILALMVAASRISISR
jgi:hypothetical protein